jgi:hypothetical protein
LSGSYEILVGTPIHVYGDSALQLKSAEIDRLGVPSPSPRVLAGMIRHPPVAVSGLSAFRW